MGPGQAKTGQLVWSRREFLLKTGIGLLSIPVVGGLSSCFFSKREQQHLLISGRSDPQDRSFISVLDINGQILREIPVSGRCHAVAVDPIRNHRAVVFPKRPGYVAYLVDFNSGTLLKEFRCKDGRFFYGHGCFSYDGKQLFATENDYNNKRGIISVWDGETMAQLGELPSFGIGPHEAALMPGGKIMAIANGGVFEHPDSGGREKLNVDSMDSSLVYLDTANGQLIDQFRVPNKFMGMRHLSIGGDGLIAVAIQDEGPKDQPTPLVAFQRPGESLKIASAPDDVLKQMNKFALSITLADKEGTACVTNPHANLVTFWNSNTAQYIGSHQLIDAGGATYCPSTRAFIVSTGQGQIWSYSASDPSNRRMMQYSTNNRWDNHFSKEIVI